VNSRQCKQARQLSLLDCCCYAGICHLAFQHLFCHTLHAVPTDHPYTVALDGTTVPRTGAYIPSAHWTPNPANAPFARGLRKAQRFTRAGWLDDDPNARCVPICWLPTFSQNARYANPASRRSEIQGWIARLQRIRAWLGVGWMDGWCALGRVSGSCALDFSGCVVGRAA
jgi:hypothetical protein